MLSPHITRLGAFFLFAFLALSGWSQSEFEQAVFTTQQGDRIYVEIDAYSLQEALDSAFHFLNPDNSAEYNSWSDVLQNGSNPEMDLDLEGYDISNAGQITTNGTLTGDSLYLYKDGVVVGTFGVSGATNLGSSLSVTGTVTFSSTLSVSGATTLSSTLDVTGNSTVGGTLGVTGATTLSNTLAVTGNADLDGTLDVDGTTELDGLNVDGTTTMDGTTMDGNLDLNGDADVSGTATINDLDVTTNVDAATAAITGNATVGGTLGVTGATTLSNTLAVTGNADLDGTLDVDGTTELDGLNVDGATTMDGTTIDGNLDLNGDADVSGTATINDLDVTTNVDAATAAITGNATVGGTLGVTGNAMFGADLSVDGDANLDTALVAGHFQFDGPDVDINASDAVTVDGNTIGLNVTDAELSMSTEEIDIALHADDGSGGWYSEILMQDDGDLSTIDMWADEIRLAVSGALDLSSYGDTVTLSGATKIDGTMRMDGDLDLNGDAEVSGDLDVSAGTLTLAAGQVTADKVGGGYYPTSTYQHTASTLNYASTTMNLTSFAGFNTAVGTSMDIDGDLDVSGANLTLAAGQVGADKVGAGTFGAGTYSFSGSTISDLGTVTTADINGGNIDGATIGTSNITIGAANTLDVSAGALTLAAGQVTADKVGAGTFDAGTYSFAGSTISDLGEVVNAYIHGGLITDTYITISSSGYLATNPGSTVDLSYANLTLDDDQISGDAINGGTIGTVTIGQLNLASGAESPATRSTVLGTLIPAASSTSPAAISAPYNTGTYIDLPTGKWQVFINMQTDQGYNSMLMHGSGSGGGFIELGLSSSNASYTPVPSQFHAESQVGGALDGDHSTFDMIQGQVLVENSGATARYYLWVSSIIDSSGNPSGSASVWTNPGSDYWDLNSFYAVPVNW